jgi:hypothetical protein
MLSGMTDRLRCGRLSQVSGHVLAGLLVAVAIVGCSGSASSASATAGANHTLSPSRSPSPALTPAPAGSTATARPSESSPEAIVDGTLRSSAQARVVPPEYRSGLLSQSLGDAWVARVEKDYRRWYAPPKLDDMITGIHNVAGASEAGGYPIVTSADGMSIDVPSASVNGDEATVDDATISYVMHYAPGAWAQLDVPYSMMCYYTLHRTPDGWRVTDAACSDSGG